MSSFDWKKKHWRFYRRQIDHKYHHERNILRAKGGKCKTTKGVPRCHGYHETWRWNSRWCPCQRLCSLQKMDQSVIQQQRILWPLLRAIKLYDTIGWEENVPRPRIRIVYRCFNIIRLTSRLMGAAFMSFLVGISHSSRSPPCIIQGW